MSRHILVSSTLVSNNPVLLSAQIKFQTEDYSFLAEIMQGRIHLGHWFTHSPCPSPFFTTSCTIFPHSTHSSSQKVEVAGYSEMSVLTYHIALHCSWKAIIVIITIMRSSNLIHNTIYIKPVSSTLMWSNFCQPQTFWDTNQSASHL